jgi:hypothetical protein
MAFLYMGFQDPLGATFKSARGTDHACSPAIRQVPATQNHYHYVRSAQGLVLFLKGHGNEADFLGFLQKLVPNESLTLPFEPFRFWLRIRGDIHIQKRLPAITDTGSRRLRVSVIRGVADSRITDTRSRQLPASLIH